MILSNIELFSALDEGRLIIRPEPGPRLPALGQAHSPFDTHSVDLSLGDEITVPKEGQITYDLTQPGSIADTIRQHSETLKISELQPFCLKPHRFVLGRTHEHIELPIFARPPDMSGGADRGKEQPRTVRHSDSLHRADRPSGLQGDVDAGNDQSGAGVVHAPSRYGHRPTHRRRGQRLPNRKPQPVPGAT